MCYGAEQSIWITIPSTSAILRTSCIHRKAVQCNTELVSDLRQVVAIREHENELNKLFSLGMLGS